jgi:hypothetical protein
MAAATSGVTWRERMKLTDALKLTLRRWRSVLLLAILGGIVFEVSLAVGWRYARPLPEPTRWFRAWFVVVAVWCGLVAVAFVAAEPIRFRTRHLRYLHRYPPLWLSIVLGVGIAAVVESVLPSAQRRVLPLWRQFDIIAALMIVATLGAALRQRPWRWKTRDDTASRVPASLSWDVLRAWFQREEPLTHGPDLLGHEPIAERIGLALAENTTQSIALIGPVGSGKSSILNTVKRNIDRQTAPLTIVADFNCWAMPTAEDAPRVALERAVAVPEHHHAIIAARDSQR